MAHDKGDRVLARLVPRQISFLVGKTHQAGFTLIEVLIALIVLALAFSASYLTMSSTARQLLILEDKTAATWVGLNVIARAQLGVISLPQTNGNVNGQEQMLNQNWFWKLALLTSPDVNVLQLMVEVAKSSSLPSSVQLTGYMVNPASGNRVNPAAGNTAS